MILGTNKKVKLSKLILSGQELEYLEKKRSTINRIGVIKRYYRYMGLILKKYGKLALSTWYKEYYLKKLGVNSEKTEDVILKQFEFFRDVRLGDLLKK